VLDGFDFILPAIAAAPSPTPLPVPLGEVFLALSAAPVGGVRAQGSESSAATPLLVLPGGESSSAETTIRPAAPEAPGASQEVAVPAPGLTALAGRLLRAVFDYFGQFSSWWPLDPSEQEQLQEAPEPSTERDTEPVPQEESGEEGEGAVAAGATEASAEGGASEE
jgi:hypothetical protein